MRIRLEQIRKAFQENSALLSVLQEGVAIVARTPIFEFLRLRGLPELINDGANPQVMATQAAFSAGYQACLEDLLYFKEKHVDIMPQAQMPRIADFNAIDLAMKRGYLTEEEADECRAKQ